MCMELESLVPITCSEARQVVLIGDHKQLQPIIKDNLAMKLGLSVSKFERLSVRAKMLELQYRMVREYRTLFISLIVSGILRILQSDWFRERAVFSYLLTTVTVTAGNSAGEIVMFS